MSLTWVAEYSNGETIKETDKQFSYLQLDRRLLKSLKLVDDVGTVKAEVTANNGEVLFYRIRSVLAWSTGRVVARHYFLGWRKRENNQIKTYVITLTSDGERIELPRPFQNDHWYLEEQV